jgi:hypothetical protein
MTSGAAAAAAARSEWRVSGAVLAGVLALGVALGVSLPRQANERITLDISCVSGAPVVGVWVEAENGGSGFAEPAGGGVGAGVGVGVGVGASGRERFAFELGFAGTYEVHAGCGGSRERWHKVAHSDPYDDPTRTLLCDDTVAVATTSEPGPCQDLR